MWNVHKCPEVLELINHGEEGKEERKKKEHNLNFTFD